MRGVQYVTQLNPINRWWAPPFAFDGVGGRAHFCSRNGLPRLSRAFCLFCKHSVGACETVIRMLKDSAQRMRRGPSRGPAEERRTTSTPMQTTSTTYEARKRPPLPWNDGRKCVAVNEANTLSECRLSKAHERRCDVAAH